MPPVPSGPDLEPASSRRAQLAHATLTALAASALLVHVVGQGTADGAAPTAPAIVDQGTGVASPADDVEAGLASPTAPAPEQIVDQVAVEVHVDLADAGPSTPWIEVADPDAGQTGATPSPPPSRTLADVPYLLDAHPGCDGLAGDEGCSGSQTLDVYKAIGSTPNPVVLWVHGGGWVGGDKKDLADPVRRAHEQGFDIVSVNYRLASGPRPARFPAAVHDTKAAVRWVKANAATYDFDPEAIVAVGHSAGAHLVQMLATTADVPGLEPTDGLDDDQAEQTSRVAAVVSFAAMSDLPTFLADGHAWSPDLTAAFLGCAFDCAAGVLEQASPTSHVTADDAPIYAVTGAVDPLALPHVTDVLGDRYGRAGVGDRFFDDAVDTGPVDCQGHNPWCGTSVTGFDRFLGAVGNGAAPTAAT